MTEPELKFAFKYFTERVTTYSKRGLTDGFRRIDSGGKKGSLSGDDLRTFFMEGAAEAPWFVNDRTINVLIDWADINEASIPIRTKKVTTIKLTSVSGILTSVYVWYSHMASTC